MPQAVALTDPSPRSSTRLPDWSAMIGILLICLVVFQGIDNWLDVTTLGLPSALIMIAIVPYLLVRGGKVGRLFVMLSLLTAAVALVRLEDAPALLKEALIRAAFFQAFLTAVFTLQEAASRSESINRVGLFLISQPLRKQSVLTLIGTNVMALMMNMGSLVMIGTLARDRMASDDDGATGATERGWMTAVAAIRGFSPSVTWSPLALPPVLLSSLYAGVSLTETMMIGLAISLVIFVVSCLFTFGQATAILRKGTTPFVEALALPVSSVAKLIALLITIFTAIYFSAHQLDMSTSAAVIVIIPVTSCLWLIFGLGHSIGTLIEGPLKNMVFQRLPSQAAETSVIVSAAFLGPVLVKLFPMQEAAQVVVSAHLTGAWLLSLIFLATIALAMIGLNPVLTSTLVVAIIGDPATFGVTPINVVAVLLTAWALAAQFSPYTGTAAIVSRMFNVSPVRLIFVQNGPFMVLSLGIALTGIYLIF